MCYVVGMKLKFMSMLCLVAVGILAFAISGKAAEGKWLTDYDKALAQAKQENKKVLIDFTGSDWCPWCIKLHDEVFSKQAFNDYADKNLVLLIIDFPRKKQQTDAEKKTNEALAQKYGIQGFPTVVVLDSAGKKIGELGYQPGGPQPFVAELEKLK